MGKIEQAREVLAGVEAEIDDLRTQRREHVRRLAVIAGSLAPGDLAEAEQLNRAISMIDARLQGVDSPSSASNNMSQLAWALLKARQDLENVRRERANLTREVERLDALAELWGPHLAEAEAAIEALRAVCAAVGYPPGLTDRDFLAWPSWVRGIRQQLDARAGLRLRIARYGADPDYQEPGDWQSETDRAFLAARDPGAVLERIKP